MNQEDTLEKLMKEETEDDKVATTCKELNSDNNHVSLKMDPSLVEPSDETPVLANTLIVA